MKRQDDVISHILSAFRKSPSGFAFAEFFPDATSGSRWRIIDANTAFTCHFGDATFSGAGSAGMRLGELLPTASERTTTNDGDFPDVLPTPWADVYMVVLDASGHSGPERLWHDEERHLAFTLMLGDALRDIAGADAVMTAMSAFTLAYMRLDWCCYGDIFGGNVRLRPGAVSPGSSPMAGIGEIARASTLTAAFEAGTPSVIDNIGQTDGLDPALKARCRELGIGSLMIVPVIENAQPKGLLFLARRQPRKWSRLELSLAEDMAGRMQEVAAHANSEKNHDERFCALMTEMLPVGLGFLDTTGKFRFLNAEMKRFIPKETVPSKDAEEGQRWKAWDANGDRIDPRNFPGARALRGETVVPGDELLFTDLTGREIWTRVSAIPVTDASGAVTGAIAVVDDIDQAKQNELRLKNFSEQLEAQVSQRTAELESSKDFLNAVLDSSPDMIQVFSAVRDDKQKIVDFHLQMQNKIAENVFGDNVGQLLRRSQPEFIAAGVFDNLIAVMETGSPRQHETFYAGERMNGWFCQWLVQFDDGVATTTADVTRRKTAELEISVLNDELRRTNRELEILSSELRTFTTIAATDYESTLHRLYISFEQVLKSDGMKLSDASKAAMRRSQSGLQRLKFLTQDIISFSNLSQQKYELEKIDFGDVVQKVVQDMDDRFAAKGASVTVDTDLPVLNGFRVLLRLLVRNIFDNAMKFSHPERALRIHVSARTVTGAEIGPDTNAAHYHCVAFTDNGAGFNGKHAENLFRVFYRENADGVGHGIGLAVCQKIMVMHQGTITAENRNGQGAVLICYFPISD